MGRARVRELPLEGAFLLMPNPVRDERGSFAQGWSEQDFQAVGATASWACSAYAHNSARGTLRGLHYQDRPHEEAKTVCCVRGAIWDVIVDIRPGSTTYLQWHAEHLTSTGLEELFVPVGFAHGYITLADDTLVSYRITPGYQRELARGIRWDDPTLKITWPSPPTVISERDRTLPLWSRLSGRPNQSEG